MMIKRWVPMFIHTICCQCKYQRNACMARTFEPASVHVGTLHTFVLIKSNPPSHGVHDALWLFKDLLLHEVVIATCGG